MPMAFVVMLAYGVGTAGVLLGAGLASESALRRWRGGGLRSAAWGMRVLGGTLLLLGLAALLGLDKWVETQAVRLLPGWVFMI